MRNPLNSIVRKALISVLGILLTFFLVVGMLLQFIFTPEKITPTILRVLNDNLNAQVACERIELTFFSTFPHFGVKLEKGSIHNQSFSASTGDTLARFKSGSATIDLDKLLRYHVIEINKLTLQEPVINATIDARGNGNWNIVKPAAPDTAQTQEDGFAIKGFILKKFTIEKGDLTYKDLSTKTQAHFQDYNIILKATDNQEELTLDLISSGKNLMIAHKDLTFIKNINLFVKTEIHLNKKTNIVHFTNGAVKLNDVDFVTNGKLMLDSAGKKVQMDVAMALKVPKLHTLWEHIPAHLIQKKDIAIQGQVALNMTAKGTYGQGKYPVTNINLKIINGAVKYKGFPGRINKLDADIHSALDLNNISNSVINIRQLMISGMGINLSGTGKILNLVNSPQILTDLKANVDLTTIKQAYPISKNLRVNGQADVDLKTSLLVSELKNYNFRNLRLLGHVRMKNLLIDSPTDSLFFKTPSLTVAMGGNGMAQGKDKFGSIQISKLKVAYKKTHELEVAGLHVDLKTETLAGSRAMLHAGLKVQNLKYVGLNNTKAFFRKAQATAKLTPGKIAKRPNLALDFAIDSAAFWQGKQFVGILNGNYAFTIGDNNQNKWTPQGHIEFNNLHAYTPDFPLPMHMKHSRIQVKGNELVLNNAYVKIGHSDVTLTGKIDNIWALHQPASKKIQARLKLQANFIDANEMMQALHQKQGEMPAPEQAPVVLSTPEADTVTSRKAIFAIPKNIEFTFESAIAALRFGDLDIKNVHGQLKVDEGAVILNGFTMETFAAKLRTNLTYRPVNNTRAQVRFRFALKEIQLDKLTKLMPAMDTLMPMIGSFEGNVNFTMQGIMNLNEKMEVDLPSLRSIAAMQAKDIMVLDSETFRELAKTFKFKTRDKNTIDTLNMEMLIEKKHMEVLPALVQIDRYKLAVGGIQNIDLTYDYHITVLESPIPFKTGVNVRGNFDDYKVSLDKAKYKYYFTDKERLKEKADSSVIKKKQAILKRLNLAS